MTSIRGSLGAGLVAACALAAACGPLWLDRPPQIRGTVVTVDGRTVDIEHKTGRIYRIEVTEDTRIADDRRPGDVTLCPGQRATVSLVARRQFTASSITVWSGRCR